MAMVMTDKTSLYLLGLVAILMLEPESGKCLTFAGLQRLGGETPGAVEDWGQMLLCIQAVNSLLLSLI